MAENSMNQWSFVKKAGVSLALFFERLPDGLRHLPFVNETRIPPFPHSLERGIRPPGDFFDLNVEDDEQALWAYASDDFKAFGYERFDSGFPEESSDYLLFTHSE